MLKIDIDKGQNYIIQFSGDFEDIIFEYGYALKAIVGNAREKGYSEEQIGAALRAAQYFALGYISEK